MATTKKQKPETETKVKKTIAVKSSYLELPVYDLQGADSKTITLPKEIFSVEASPRLLAQYVRVFLTNQRQGTASTKGRSEVIGSTRKIFRQKGTGRARHGSIKAPIFVGGGVVGGPKPREFDLKMNKKQKKKAFFYALSLKAKEKNVQVLANEALTMEPKTKVIAALFQKVGNTDKKTMLVVPKMENNGLVKSARNVANVAIKAVAGLNPYEVTNYEKLMFTEGALQELENHFLKKHE